MPIIGSFTLYSEDATTDINAKYVKRRDSAQRCAFFTCRVAKPKFNIYTPFSHFGARFRRHLEIFGRKTASALRCYESKRNTGCKVRQSWHIKQWSTRVQFARTAERSSHSCVALTIPRWTVQKFCRVYHSDFVLHEYFIAPVGF